MSDNRDIKYLPQLIAAFALVALVAGISVVILDEFRAQQVFNITVTNETNPQRVTAGTAYGLLGANRTYFITIENGTVRCYNATGEIVQPGNFSYAIATGLVTRTTGGKLNFTANYSFNYSYTHGSEARDIYAEGITGVMEISEWLELIALIFSAGIVLYLVIKAIGYERGRGGQSY